ncbi:MAG: hypothetical protein R3B90_16455 [Planctomycetaceae bacterium]
MRTPDNFAMPGDRDWWDVLFGQPHARQGEPSIRFDDAPVTPLDFPTEGLISTRFHSIGGAAELEVIWWSILKMTLVFSIALGLIAFILLKTSWENKLGVLLMIAFIATLFGVADSSALAHGLAAARFGFAFLLLLWVLHAILGRCEDGTAFDSFTRGRATGDTASGVHVTRTVGRDAKFRPTAGPRFTVDVHPFRSFRAAQQC